MDWTKIGYFYDKLLPHYNSVKNAISQMYRSNELFGPMMKSLTISVNSLLHLGRQPESVTLDNSLTSSVHSDGRSSERTRRRCGSQGPITF